MDIRVLLIRYGIYFSILLLLTTCSNYSSDKKTGIALKIISAPTSIDDFLRDKVDDIRNINYIKKLGYRKYCLIEIHNMTDSSLYFQTCSSILKVQTEYISVNNGTGQFNHQNLYNHFGNHIISELSANQKGKYAFLYKTHGVLNQKEKIDTVKTTFDFVTEKSEWMSKTNLMPYRTDIEISLICKVLDNKDIHVLTQEVLFKTPNKGGNRRYY